MTVKTISEIMQEVNKKFKKELAVHGLQDFVVQRIPFSSPRLNYQTYGGIPRGRLIEFAGPESSGKTTTALDIVSQAQILFKLEWELEMSELEVKLESKLGKNAKTELQERYNYIKVRGPLKVVFIDNEGTLDLEWALKLKVNPNEVEVLRLQMHTAEQVLEICLDIIRSGECGLIIIDSIAPLIPQQVYEESLEKGQMGGNSVPITRFVNKAVPLLGLHDCTCIVINQVRADMNNPFNEFVTPGGNALKHQDSVRLLFRKGVPIDEKGIEQKKSYDAPQGNIVLVHLQKTKVFKPDRRTGFYTLSYDYGIDYVRDTFDLAVQYDVIKKGGAWFTLVNPNTGEIFLDNDNEILKFQGTANILDYLREDKEVFQIIYEYINNLVSRRGAVVEVDCEEVREFSEQAKQFDEEEEEIEEVNNNL